MMKNIFIAITLGCLLMACDSNIVYKSFESMSSLRWEKKDKIEFTADVASTSEEHTVVLHFRHVYGFQFRNLKARIKMIAPDGEEQILHANIKIRSKNGDYLSECAGDICDISFSLLENYKFNKVGSYKFMVDHQMELDVIPNVMEVGIEIRKIEPKI